MGLRKRDNDSPRAGEPLINRGGLGERIAFWNSQDKTERARTIPSAAESVANAIRSVAQSTNVETQKEAVLEHGEDRGAPKFPEVARGSTKERTNSCPGIFHQMRKFTKSKAAKKSQKPKEYSVKITLDNPVDEAMRDVRPILQHAFKAKKFAQSSECFNCKLLYGALHIHIGLRRKTLNLKGDTGDHYFSELSE